MSVYSASKSDEMKTGLRNASTAIVCQSHPERIDRQFRCHLLSVFMFMSLGAQIYK
jgi:hypothetical protein